MDDLTLIFFLQETHLQKALTAQQFYGTAVARTIPIPDAQSVDDDRYFKLYKSDFKLPKQYIHVQGILSRKIMLCDAIFGLSGFTYFVCDAFVRLRYEIGSLRGF